ncbi:DUF6794 domain-containing protein [Bernardetia sp.]|uniref:DUF6794 domain-containing protein n=1 Tax=Bernardetia sp. TaxID=1937974 RepID=UPI0025BEE98F|nr:DUF6794 domain-containing protein [Bernardetia sp.]
MMQRLLYILTFLFVMIQTVAYSQKVRTPKNIDEAIRILNTDCPDSLKQVIKETPNDSLLYLIYPLGGEYRTITKWAGLGSKRKTKFEKYYSKLGITHAKHIEKIVLLSFKAALNDNNFIHEDIIRPFQKIEQKWRKEDKERFTTDTLRNVYIPKNLEECFKQIDSFWNDSTKLQVKEWTEDEFIAKTHFGFGRWIRNNWQLWGGSRLSKYFNQMGIYHPDDMSGIILDSYHRYLLGKEIKLEEQVKSYQDYWNKVNGKK